MPSATDFFSTAKKVGKKCRSQTPRGWHSANRFCNSTCAGLQSGLQDGCGLRDGLARCARWHDLMVFCDGFVAMAFLNDCGTSRESFAGNISHHIKTIAVQFGISGQSLPIRQPRRYSVARASTGVAKAGVQCLVFPYEILVDFALKFAIFFDVTPRCSRTALSKHSACLPRKSPVLFAKKET